MEQKKRFRRTTWWTRGLVLVGAAIFVANMIYTWKLVRDTNALIQRPLATDTEGGSATVRGLKLISDANANVIITVNHLIDAQVLYKVALNKHNMIIVAMATSFGLVAVGFALFVMGIEGAFEFQSNAGEVGRVILKATSPGLLCFLLAAAIMFYALNRAGAPVAIQGVTVFPDSEITSTVESEVPIRKVDEETIISEEEKKKFDLFK